jgi:hypothetical protein
MTTTVGELIIDTRRLLGGAGRGQRNRLTDVLSTTIDQFSVDFPLKGLSTGVYITIDDEMMYVYAVDGTTQNVTVERGVLGTTPATHAAGTFIEVSVRFPKPFIRQALEDEIRSWPGEIYTTETLALTAVSSRPDLDLTGIDTNFYRILEVLGAPKPGEYRWRELSYRIERNMDTGDYSSSVALILTHSPPVSGRVRVTYGKPFTLTAFGTDATTIASIGLTSSMLDIPPLGAAARLLGPREIVRTDSGAQGEIRIPEEVPPGYTVQTGTTFLQLRNLRLAEEARRLLNQHPWRRVA